DVQGVSEHVDAVGVLGVDADLREVERPRVQRARARPGVAAVLGAIDAAALAADIVDRVGPGFVGLDDREHDARILRGDREADACGPRRKALLQLLPGRAAVRRLEDAAQILALGLRRSRRERPGPPLAGVERGVDRAGLRRIERDVAAADAVAERRR